MIRTRGERIFNVINIVLVALITSTCLLPFIHILAKSFSANTYLLQKEVFFWPKGFTLNSYQYVLSNPQFFRSLLNSVFITVAGTVLSMLVTVLTAFVFTRNELPFQKLIVRLFIFTMFFSGGMIPTYLLYSNLHMLDTYAVLILPGAVGVFNIVLMRNFMESISPSLEESAKIDGASNVRVLFQIYVPLSKAAIATISMFFAVGHKINRFHAEKPQQRVHHARRGRKQIDKNARDHNPGNEMRNVRNRLAHALIGNRPDFIEHQREDDRHRQAHEHFHPADEQRVAERALEFKGIRQALKVFQADP